MKVYVSVDIEGIAGMNLWDDYVTDTPMNQEKRSRMRHLLTAEANAAVEGLFAGGATEILIHDGHGPSNHCDNLYIEELHPDVEIIIGSKGLPDVFPLLDETFSAAVLVGRHAMEGTPHACLPHTLTIINGMRYGEIGRFALTAGWHDVPTIFVSGDKAAVEEARQLIPNIEAAVTKEAFAPYSVKTKTPQKGRKLIREGAERALKRQDEILPLKIDPPFVFDQSGVRSDDFREAFRKHLISRGVKFGDQDVNPERQRFSELRAKRV